ncbi:lysophospholipid acyltransferase family protein [Spongiivirga citrea]|uniref:1-acyl-sn-glycerol-3-phosphate acyltransferase n=1 Tax=Spongiivirga citrea TaxID=1481457 RepID=A0A6M0CLY9_9FLAO|nr:lysophospholipid acyltransferase family protein [Spongiivirga citrea]NER17983.1 1-acyl-sn-glycerol-3-phosphate acyltransferase [Spongiivirga citrea]
MRYLKYPFWLLYRIWFYILVTVPIIILFPFLIISILKESWYPFFFRLARIWSKVILYGMGFVPLIKRAQKLNWKDSYMLIANHTSMTDIMLMLLVARSPFVFVGKAELAKIPLFGLFYKRTCILVDRSSSRSRNAAVLAAQRRLKQGLSICIFPEGGVPEDENIVLDSFKNGAFRLAIDHQIPIVPISFADNKKRFSYTFFSGGPGQMRVQVHQFLDTHDLDRSAVDELRDESWKIIYDQLMTFNHQPIIDKA